uniref:Uncharacterized protein n=1 Tax=viral metagenome TaxID=1070528 RepID=A0A6C0BKC5_9ZZZZ
MYVYGSNQSTTTSKLKERYHLTSRTNTSIRSSREISYSFPYVVGIIPLKLTQT